MEGNQNQGGLDMGWVPFEACPEGSPVEIIQADWGPLWVERDLSSGDIWMNGTMRFVDNATPIENTTVDLYLVLTNHTGNVPGGAAVTEHLVASGTTDELSLIHI